MDIGVVKTDSQLNPIWKNHYEMDESSFYDFARAAVSPAPDGGVIVCGSFKYASSLNNDLFVMKIDSSGNEVYSNFLGGDGSDAAYDLKQTSDGNIIITGQSSSSGSGSFDVYLLKFDLITGLQESTGQGNIPLRIFPNPGRSNITISFSTTSGMEVQLAIIDLAGNTVKVHKCGYMDPGKHELKWDGKDDGGTDVAAGIYFCRLVSRKAQGSRKIIISD